MDEIDHFRCQFHQRFCTYFTPIFWRQKISNPKHSFVIFGAKILHEKHARIMLMKFIVGVVYEGKRCSVPVDHICGVRK